MRLKLLTLASLIGGSAGAAVVLIVAYGFGFAPLFVAAAVALAAAFVASLFVYRHTARRRPLQALLTGFGALLVCLFALYAANRLLNAAVPVPPPLKARA